MKRKMDLMLQLIEVGAKLLGLRLVNGPGPEAKTFEQAQALSQGVRTNGQERAGIILEFAENN
jgi:hypothetical protein